MDDKTIFLTEGSKRCLEILEQHQTGSIDELYASACNADCDEDVIERTQGKLTFSFALQAYEETDWIEVEISAPDWHLAHDSIIIDTMPATIMARLSQYEDRTLKEAGVTDNPLFEDITIDEVGDSGLGEIEIKISGLWTSLEWELTKDGIQKKIAD